MDLDKLEIVKAGKPLEPPVTTLEPKQMLARFVNETIRKESTVDSITFRIGGSPGDAKRYVQSIRMALSRVRAALIDSGRSLRRFRLFSSFKYDVKSQTTLVVLRAGDISEPRNRPKENPLDNDIKAALLDQ